MKRHPLDVLSLTAGALFVALGVTFLVADDTLADAARWVWPVLLISLGVAGLASALGREDEGHPTGSGSRIGVDSTPIRDPEPWS